MLLGFVAATQLFARATTQEGTAGTVLVAEYDGIIHPIAAEFFDELIARADTSGVAAAICLSL